jgi:drug/metabolite transporter (DMT)-like permease
MQIQTVSKDKQTEHGVHFALFSLMIVWGLNLSAVKVLTKTLDVVLVSALRMVLAAAFLGVLAMLHGFKLSSWRLRDWGITLLAAFFLVYMNQIAFAEGLSRTPAMNAALVMALSPAVALLIELIAFARAVTPGQFLGIGVAFAGVASVVLTRPGATLQSVNTGDFWMLLSIIAFAIGGACVQKLTQKVQPLFVGFMVHALGSCMLVTDLVIRVPTQFSEIVNIGTWQWSLVLYSSMISTGVGGLIWARGIRTLGVGRATSYLSWIPIFGVGFGALFFADRLTLWHGVGLIGVLLGSLLITRTKRLAATAAIAAMRK